MDLALTCVTRGAILISRLRLDAQLFEFPVAEKKKLGRKHIKANAYILRTYSRIKPKYGVKKLCFGMAEKLVI